MRHNRLRHLPTEIWSLETLTSLDLSNNELEGGLPEQLGKLDKLRELGLEGNKLTQLPESIGGLSHLEVLRVENNQLSTLPSSIGRLRNLKTLSAHSNLLAELPAAFGSLTGLLTLDLKKNSLVTTGNAFAGLVSIKFIDLRQNKLEVFPTLPENNSCLDQLFLGFNALQEIPEEIVLNVKESLTVLDVRDNKLQRLSDRIPQLYRLKTLDVTNNDLHDLPAGLGYLKYLDHLLVDGNPLRSVRRSLISAGTEPLKKYLRTRGGPPEGVDAMEEEVDEFTIRQREKELDEPMAEEPPQEDEYLFRNAAASGNLQLVDMKFHQLPDRLGAAGKYRFGETLLQLDLSKNHLLELPAAIGELTSLHTLIAEQCGLKSIHSSVAMIPRLEHLRVRKNSLTTDAINALLAAGNHASICLSLKELDLRNNVLTDIPHKLQFLETMDTLLLSFNRIRALDRFPWSAMCQLSVLSISDNRIPAELALCENLRALYLAGNPQRGIRAHILNNGTEAVLKYLRNRLPPDVLPPTIGQRTPKSINDTERATNTQPLNKSNQDTTLQRTAMATLETKRLRVDPSTSSLKPQPKPAKPSPSTSPFHKQHTVPPAAPVAVTPSEGEDEVLVELNAKIVKLEQQLDDFAISAAKRFALKKDLAMTRSQKIRHLRAIGQKPYNQLEQDLSDSFGALVGLKELVLSGNKLCRLPDSIALLTNLEALHVDENALVALPDNIGRLHKLHVLMAHTNQLTSLPKSFRTLRNMQNLDLKKNRLESTSDALADLSRLKFLDLRQNKLVGFPELPEGASLDQIFLGYNTLSAIDETSILRIKDAVTVLDMRDNKLAKLPANIACLYRLKTLDVANNNLSDLPPGLGYLKHLNHFIVDGNPLRAIRRSVISSGCESLKKYLRTRGPPPVGVDVLEEERDELQLERERSAQTDNMTMVEVPTPAVDYTAQFREAAASGTLILINKSLGELPSNLIGHGEFNFASTLLHLNLSSNQLQLLPALIGQLESLKTLTVEDNQLHSLHPSIASLPHLELLRLRKNQLSAESISDFLGDSPALGATLKELDLRSNNLSELPIEINQLRSLETLLLAYNRIETLDRFPWSHLAKVSVISVSDNKLRSLGRIYDAPLLASLSFENNNLNQVPCELGLCPHLRAIYMNGNPQRTVRGAVIAKGSAEILAYLKNKLPPNAVLSPPSPVATPRPAKPARSSPKKNARATSTSFADKRPASGTSPRPDDTYAAQGAVTSQNDGPAPVAPVESFAAPKENAAVELELTKLSKQIEQLELQLDNHALSAPKRFALKKELAMVRSKKLREARKLQ
ncbi:unnamed protein product [Phytophthora fragariaefolia]|uniref:Unnamed protein product n=1 Tax=Phytophthora fragariaefolia TaxID=1490495 RepID=A0A9W6TXX9_9STRA|nr:unnamed protein product [Phytophthora fragariaefolia]